MARSSGLDVAKIAYSLRSGALLFCPDCGTLLDLPEADADSVTCEQCGFVEPASCEQFPLHCFPNSIDFLFVVKAYENIVITTRSHPDAFPSALRQKRKTQTKVHESGETPHHCKFILGIVTCTVWIDISGVQVSELCPACGHHEAYSIEKQVQCVACVSLHNMD